MATTSQRLAALEAWKTAHLNGHVLSGHLTDPKAHGHPHPVTPPSPDPVPVPPPPPPPPPPTGGYPPETQLAYIAPPALGPLPGYLVPVVEGGIKRTRVSNTAGLRHAYSRIPAFNKDGSKILLGFTPSSARMIDGQTYADIGAFNPVPFAIWSNLDVDKLFGAQANRFVSQNGTTGAVTTLHTFAGYSAISIGNYEGGISDDDQWVALFGTPTGGGQHLLTYNIATDTVLATVTVSGQDNCQISRLGNYVVTGGSGGTRRYPRNLSSSIVLSPYANHGDNALDASGNEIFVGNNNPAVGTNFPHVRSFRLSDGAATVLLPGSNAFSYGHVSGRNFLRPGWIYLSVYDTLTMAGKPGVDQVVAVKTDGSGTVNVFGFANHRTNGSNYASQPHAVPSPDGKKVLIASDWGGVIHAYVLEAA